MKNSIIFALLRLTMGWLFFWAFIDKLFGLGIATKPEAAWLAGGSPTTGFLKFAVKGPFASFFQSLAGQAYVDWLFMIGLLLIGLCLILGIGIRIASWSGALMMALMYFALLPPDNNPFVDDHLINFFVLLSFPLINAGDHFGLGKWWSETELVKKIPIFK